MPHRFHTLQAFRGLAALAVVAFHAVVLFREYSGVTVLKLAIPGCSGVDFFFVLSGFIIYTVHAPDFGRPEQLPEFLRRRFIRVYPLYFLLSLLLVGAYALHFGHYSKLNPEVVVKSLLLLPQRPGAHPILNNGWTLCHEMLFYLLFAVAICRGRKARTALAAAFLLLTLVNCFVPLPGPYWLHTWLFSPYNVEFAAGGAAAWLSKHPVQMALPFGIATLSASWLCAVRQWIPLGDGAAASMLLFFGVPYFLIVLGAASLERRAAIAVPRVLGTLGDASYSIYLSHFAVVSALTSQMYKLAQPAFCTVLEVWVLAAAAGYFVYLYVEKPLLDRMRSFKPGAAPAKANRIPALDGLRALSIVFVVYAHLSSAREIPKAFRAAPLGPAGVFIFFVISGYLITRNLLEEKRATGAIHIGYFLLRRAFRLLPASFAMILVSWLMSRLGFVQLDPRSLVHAVTYTMDFHNARTTTLSHLWSLSVEEQFYLAWPLVVLLCCLRNAKLVCASVLLLCPILRALAWYFGDPDHALVFRSFQLVADSLAAGCLLAMMEDRLPRWTRSNAAVFVCLAIIAAQSAIARHAPGIFILGITVFSVCAAVIVRALSDGRLWISKCFAYPPFAWLGSVSYSLYLWQQLFIASSYPAARLRLFQFPYNLAAAVATAVLSYYLLEKPVRTWGARFRPSSKTAPASIGAAA